MIHASVDEAAFGAPTGRSPLGTTPVVLGVGSADPLPVTNERGDTVRSMAMIVEIGAKSVSWKRIAGE